MVSLAEPVRSRQLDHNRIADIDHPGTDQTCKWGAARIQRIVGFVRTASRIGCRVDGLFHDVESSRQRGRWRIHGVNGDRTGRLRHGATKSILEQDIHCGEVRSSVQDPAARNDHLGLD
jgi:hypothetical protein